MTMNRNQWQQFPDWNQKKYNRPKPAFGPLKKLGLSQREPYDGETPLRDKQACILASLKDYSTRHSYPPTIREITEVCHISSTSVTDHNLRLQEHRSCLTRKPGSARSIVPTGQGSPWLPPVHGSSIREAAA